MRSTRRRDKTAMSYIGVDAAEGKMLRIWLPNPLFLRFPG